MSKVAIKGNPLGTGTFTIESPNSDTDSTILLPVGGGSVVLTDATQTLTNKSISSAQVNSGTLDLARIPNLDTSKITTGTMAPARLASGTPDATNFLRGDGSWQVISTTPTTAQVLTATAGATELTVGTYTYAMNAANANTTTGGTIAGSSLRRDMGVGGFQQAFSRAPNPSYGGGGTSLSGTWRKMGGSNVYSQEGPDSYGQISRYWGLALYLRIS